MRMRTIFPLLLVIVVSLAAAGHFLFGWWRPAQPEAVVSSSGYEAKSEQTTLPDVLQVARDALAKIESGVHDFSGVLFKEERDGNTAVKKYIFIKFREKPFSVYLYFLSANDKDANGREVIYAQGRNDGKMLVHTPGLLDKTWGTMRLDPTGYLAMQGEHHAITDMGLANLCRQLIQRGEAADPAQVGVWRYPNARINSRACTLYELYPIWDEKTKQDYLVRVFVDKEWGFPIRVEIYAVPKDRKEDPQLEEEYTYLDLKLNNGYTDADFDPKNPQYHFP